MQSSGVIALPEISFIEDKEPENLAEECFMLQQQHAILRDLCEKERKNSQALHEEIDILKKAVEDKERHRQQLERVVQFLRERAEGSKYEILNLQKDFHETLNSMSALNQQIQSSKEEISTLSQNLQRERQVKEDLQEEVKTLQMQFETLKMQVQTSRQELDQSKETINSLQQSLEEKQKDLTSQIEAYTKENEQLQSDSKIFRDEMQFLQESLATTKSSLEEKEHSLKVAQQHLAKKIKEASYYNEKYEESHQQNVDLQQSLLESQVKVSSLQQNIDLQLEHERRIQNQLKDNLNNAESLAKRWEDKYFQYQNKCEEIESQNRALKSVEEKYSQLQILFSNLNALMGFPHNDRHLSSVVQSKEIINTPTQAVIENTSSLIGNSQERASHNDQENAFRYKQSIFD